MGVNTPSPSLTLGTGNRISLRWLRAPYLFLTFTVACFKSCSTFSSPCAYYSLKIQGIRIQDRSNPSMTTLTYDSDRFRPTTRGIMASVSISTLQLQTRHALPVPSLVCRRPTGCMPFPMRQTNKNTCCTFSWVNPQQSASLAAPHQSISSMLSNKPDMAGASLVLTSLRIGGSRSNSSSPWTAASLPS